MGDPERSRHRDVHLWRPVLGSGFEERLALGRGRVVDEHVDGAQLALDSLDGVSHRVVHAKVATDGCGLHAERAGFGGPRFGAFGRRVIVKGDAGPFPGEGEADGPPETLTGPARELIQGAYKLPDGLLLVLDIDKVVPLSVGN